MPSKRPKKTYSLPEATRDMILKFLIDPGDATDADPIRIEVEALKTQNDDVKFIC